MMTAKQPENTAESVWLSDWIKEEVGEEPTEKRPQLEQNNVNTGGETKNEVESTNGGKGKV